MLNVVAWLVAAENGIARGRIKALSGFITMPAL
jgi:hypothetical protein